MNTVKILHCADVHIGAAESSLGTLAESRRAETLITFEKIINLAKESQVNVLLIAGDLFNSNNVDKSFADRVFKCFASIPDVKIVYAAGNHDPLNADSPLKNTLYHQIFSYLIPKIALWNLPTLKPAFTASLLKRFICRV